MERIPWGALLRYAKPRNAFLKDRMAAGAIAVTH